MIKNWYLLSLFILLFPKISNSQKAPEKAKVDMYIEKCDFEPDAPAVVLFDKGNVFFLSEEGGFNIKYTRHKRVKIFKEAAFDQGEIEIPLYIGDLSSEVVQDIKATTYYYDGKTIEKTELDRNQIFEEPINKHWYQKKFAMPNLKEGCVVDYTYTVISPFIFNLPDWDFQDVIPTIYSEYQTNMIPFYTYTYRAQGFNTFDVFESGESKGLDRQFMNLTFKDMNYTFGMKNIPSFKDESFISSKEDYIKKIDFQLSEINYPSGYSKKVLTTWPALAKDLMDYVDFGTYIKKSAKIGSKEFTHLQSKNDMEKIEAVLKYMKNNYKYNGRNSYSASESIKNFMKLKTGNSANINLMALGLLQSLNVDCKPVIISTRDHGKVYENFPFADFFNYVLIIATVADKKLILDATDPYCPTNLIPANCCNGKGFIVDEEEEKWANIYNNLPSHDMTSLSYIYNPETNQLEGSAMVKTTGHIAIAERKRYTSDEEKFVDHINSEGLKVKDDIAVNAEEKEDQFNYSFDFTSSVDQIDNQIIITPFMKLPVQDNPFKQKERDYSIDFVYPFVKKFQVSIKLPDKYKIEKLPVDVIRNTKSIALSYKITLLENNTLIISTNYQIKKPIYPSSAYNELKSFYKLVTEQLNQSIVVTKI